MLGIDKKPLSSRNRDGASSSRSRKKSSKRKSIVLKKRETGQSGMSVSKSGKIKITSVDANQKMYLKKESKSKLI